MIPDYFPLEPALIVAAHPDDVTIGFGGQFGIVGDTYVIHVTDGAPRSTPCRERYASERRQELAAAMGLAHVRPSGCLELGGSRSGKLFFSPLSDATAAGPDRGDSAQSHLHSPV